MWPFKTPAPPLQPPVNVDGSFETFAADIRIRVSEIARAVGQLASAIQQSLITAGVDRDRMTATLEKIEANLAELDRRLPQENEIMASVPSAD